MGVNRTDQWLLELWNQPTELCKKLEKRFEGVSAPEIYRYLCMHGMFQHPLKDGKDVIVKLQKNAVWDLIQKEAFTLRKKWDGPDVPIFIFPSDPNNVELRRNFNSKSGLAFVDKLFLFVSTDNSENEIKALFTHEYNHVCRLNQFEKEEKEYTLLDTIILEGLAENAVHEQLGDAYLAKWTSYYSAEELERMWKRLILPFIELPKHQRKHQQLLYGLQFYPKMAGYSTGYYLVKQYLKENKHMTSAKLLSIPSKEIAQLPSP